MKVFKILLIATFFPMLHAIVQWLYYMVFDIYLEKMYGKKEAQNLIGGRTQSIQRFVYWDIKDKLNPFQYKLYWLSHLLFVAIIISMVLRVFEVPNAVLYGRLTGLAYFSVLSLLRVSDNKMKK